MTTKPLAFFYDPAVWPPAEDSPAEARGGPILPCWKPPTHCQPCGSLVSAPSLGPVSPLLLQVPTVSSKRFLSFLLGSVFGPQK